MSKQPLIVGDCTGRAIGRSFSAPTPPALTNVAPDLTTTGSPVSRPTVNDHAIDSLPAQVRTAADAARTPRGVAQLPTVGGAQVDERPAQVALQSPSSQCGPPVGEGRWPPPCPVAHAARRPHLRPSHGMLHQTSYGRSDLPIVGGFPTVASPRVARFTPRSAARCTHARPRPVEWHALALQHLVFPQPCPRRPRSLGKRGGPPPPSWRAGFGQQTHPSPPLHGTTSAGDISAGRRAGSGAVAAGTSMARQPALRVGTNAGSSSRQPCPSACVPHTRADPYAPLYDESLGTPRHVAGGGTGCRRLVHCRSPSRQAAPARTLKAGPLESFLTIGASVPG
jgi:hypothetical protein